MKWDYRGRLPTVSTAFLVSNTLPTSVSFCRRSWSLVVSVVCVAVSFPFKLATWKGKEKLVVRNRGLWSVSRSSLKIGKNLCNATNRVNDNFIKICVEKVGKNQTFWGYSFFLGGVKATECTRNVTFKWKSKTKIQRYMCALTLRSSYEIKVPSAEVRG